MINPFWGRHIPALYGLHDLDQFVGWDLYDTVLAQRLIYGVKMICTVIYPICESLSFPPKHPTAESRNTSHAARRADTHPPFADAQGSIVHTY